MVRRYGKTLGRRVVAIIGFLLDVATVVVGATAENPYVAIVFLSLGDGFLHVAVACRFGAVIDIDGPYTGVTYGLVTIMAVLGGVVAPILTPILAERFGWNASIAVIALLAIVASLVWLKIDAGKALGIRAQHGSRV